MGEGLGVRVLEKSISNIQNIHYFSLMFYKNGGETLPSSLFEGLRHGASLRVEICKLNVHNAGLMLPYNRMKLLLSVLFAHRLYF